MMGIFGRNKEKKNKAANSNNKQVIINLLETIKQNCRNADAMGWLRKVQDLLQNQPETSDENVKAIDGEIYNYLTEANKNILKNQYSVAITQLSKAYNRAVDRQSYCMVGGSTAGRGFSGGMTMNVPQQQKTRAEILQDQLDAETRKLAELQSEFEMLKEQHTKDPRNLSIISRANSVKSQMAACTTQISNLSVELDKEMNDTLLSELAKSNENLTRGRTFSESETEVNRSTIIAQNEERQRIQEQNEVNRNLLGNGAIFASDPFATDVFGTNAISNPFGDSVSAPTATANNKTTQYGDFDAKGMGTTEMKRDIERQIRALKESIDTFNNQIDDANEELASINSELRSYLMRRETASPSDCLALDGKIDQINSRRSGIIYKIKRFRQLVAQQSDKLSLIEKLSTQQDITATNMKIQELTGGRFADYEGLAMFLNDSVKQSNEELENIGTAVSVSESEDVLMGSFSGASAALNDASLTKDEGKYDSLMTELGMPLAH